jgi:hypothetical protein
MDDPQLIASENPQRGVTDSVNRIRKYRDIWEREGTKLGLVDTSLKTLNLIASASIAAFGQDLNATTIKLLGLAAFLGTALAGAHRLAKKSDIYWRAWRIVNWKMISYDAGEVDFSKLAEAYREAEHLFEGWQAGDRSSATPRSPKPPR